MKTMILALAMMVVGVSAQAAPLDIYSTVLKDKAVKAAVKEAAGGGYANVQGINETASFRCMGCYAFEINVLVSEGDQLIEKVLEVRTQAAGAQKVKVSSVTLK